MPSVAALAVSFRFHAVARIPSPFHSYFLRTMATSETAPVSFPSLRRDLSPSAFDYCFLRPTAPVATVRFSFFSPCLALLAHTSRDVFVRCFQRCPYGSSAFGRAPAKIHQPAPASTANASNICSPHRTVPIPGREGARLRCAALASQDQWRGDVFLLGIFFVGTNLDIVGGRRGVVVVGWE